jgi:hypothetical protein
LAAVFLTTSGTSLLAFLMLPWGCMPRATRQSSQFHTFNREMYRLCRICTSHCGITYRYIISSVVDPEPYVFGMRGLPDSRHSSTPSPKKRRLPYAVFALLMAELCRHFISSVVDPDPSLFCTNPDPSIYCTSKKSKKNLDFSSF